MNPSMSGQATVLHSAPDWLPQTMTWLYNQVRFLPSHISSHIACERTMNLEQFNLPNLHCFAEKHKGLFIFENLLYGLGLRKRYSFTHRIARQTAANILHSHFCYRGWADMRTATALGLKHVVSVYGYDVTGLPKTDPRWVKRYSELFDRVDKVLCEGPHMAQCIANLGCPENKILVHHLGVDVDQIEFQPRERAPGEPLKVLIAASFREKKGIPYALEALGQLKDKKPLKITLIGDANSEPRSKQEKQKILHVIDKYKLGPNIRLMGYQPHQVLIEEARKHDVFLTPSVTASDGDTEGGAPVIIPEMMALGLPVIGTKHCDIPQFLQHESTGLLAEERDVEGLAHCIMWLTNHPERWASMLESGRKLIEKEFNARIQGERLAGIYREILASR